MSKPNTRDINNALRIVQLKLKLGMIGNAENKFDMSSGYFELCNLKGDEVHYCKSVGCIGGYVEYELNVEPFYLLQKVENKGDGLGKLFFPEGYGKGQHDYWSGLTSKQAVKAIDNYFKGRVDPWKGVAKRNTNKKYLRMRGDL